MSILNSICTNCGGKVQLDDSKEKGFCMHCGGEINIKAVSKSIKLDESSKLDNLIHLLKEAKNSGNNNKAEKLADDILTIDSSIALVWEIKANAILWQSTIKDTRLREGIQSYVSAIENYSDEDKDENATTILSEYKDFLNTFVIHVSKHYGEFPTIEIKDYLIRLINLGLEGVETISNFITDIDNEIYINNLLVLIINNGFNNAENNYISVINNASTEYEFDKLNEIILSYLSLVDFIIKFTELSDSNKKDILSRAINYCTRYKNLRVNTLGDTYFYNNSFKQKDSETWKATYISEMQKLDPSYIPPKEGCYIATNIYGDYNHPSVWVLRRYRDIKLRKTFLGKTFIKVYYKVSPVLVEKFGKFTWFNNFFKFFIEHKVDQLTKEGFSDQKYSDQ